MGERKKKPTTRIEFESYTFRCIVFCVKPSVMKRASNVNNNSSNANRRRMFSNSVYLNNKSQPDISDQKCSKWENKRNISKWSTNERDVDGRHAICSESVVRVSKSNIEECEQVTMLLLRPLLFLYCTLRCWCGVADSTVHNIWLDFIFHFY